MLNRKKSMEDKFVYIVECSSGSYDSSEWWIDGIFEKKEDADKHAQELNDEKNRFKELDPPYRKKVEDMTNEELTEYMKWWDYKFDAMEFNGAIVKKYPLNKPASKQGN